MMKRGIKILEVEANSLGEDIGLTPGDHILAINGHEIPDILALEFYLAEGCLDLGIRRSSGIEENLEVDVGEGAALGIKVEEFRTRICNNSCLFCFVDQLPQGVRPGLQVKDDDYRLSFLHGNYITLTNLQEKDIERIIEQRLSPLYVSVHATDPRLRTRILGRKKADNLDRKMKKLIAGGIQLHTQIVLMPEINDGINLKKTIFDLYRFYPGVSSIALVPLGLSDHGLPQSYLLPITASYCREVIQQVIPWQDHFRNQIGRTFAYLADEFYIQGGVKLPDTAYYDDFAQIEDGVGMVRKFLNEFDAELKRNNRWRPSLRATLVTARLFYPTLRDCVGRFNRKFGSQLQICAVENRFLGKNITVAGLLSGQDIIMALNGRKPGDLIIIPNEAVSRNNGLLIDNISPDDLSQRLGKPVYSAGPTLHDFFQLLFERL